VDRDYAYNRRLFKRHSQGSYQFNPRLAVRRKTADGEGWLPVFAALNVPLIKECGHHHRWSFIDNLLQSAGMEKTAVPAAGERVYHRLMAEHEAFVAQNREYQAHLQRLREEREARQARRPARRAARAKRPAPAENSESRRPKQGWLWEEPERGGDGKKGGDTP
jgi:hypothetical protein